MEIAEVIRDLKRQIAVKHAEAFECELRISEIDRIIRSHLADEFYAAMMAQIGWENSPICVIDLNRAPGLAAVLIGMVVDD